MIIKKHIEKHHYTLHNLFKKKLLFNLILIFLVFCLSFTFGYKFYSYKRSSSNKNLMSIVRNSYKMPSHFIKGLLAKPDELIINIKHMDLQKLYYENYNAINTNHGLLNTLNSGQNYVKINFKYHGQKIKGKARVKGSFRDSRSNKKLSLRIKLSGESTIDGMKIFSINDPKVKNYMSEWIFYKLLKYEKLISLRYKFIDVKINGKNSGIYAIEEHFDKRLIENNGLREGVILNIDDYLNDQGCYLLSEEQQRNWDPDFVPNSYSISPIMPSRFKKTMKNKKLYKQFIKAKNLLEAYRKKDLSLTEVFDVKKLAKIFALSDLLGSQHNLESRNIKFYYNPITGLLEPIGYDQHLPISYLKHAIGENKCLSTSKNNIVNWRESFFNNIKFYNLYIGYLRKISNPKYLEEFKNSVLDDYNNALNILYSGNPFFYDNSFSILKENQEYIQRLLNPLRTLLVYVENINNNILKLKIGNTYSLPIEIVGIKYKNNGYDNKKRMIIDAKKNMEMMKYDDVEYKFLNNIDSLLIDSLYVRYKIMGTNNVKFENVIPFPFYDINDIKNDPKKEKSRINDYKFLKINNNNEIFLRSNNICINKTIKIPHGYILRINSGTKLNITNSSLIISYSPIIAIGTKDNPIRITSSDSTGQGIVILNAKEESRFENVIFKNLSNPSQNGWELTGAITTYESPVSFYNCIFSNNLHGDDFLNIIRTNFTIDNCFFQNALADAFDCDFCKGTISNSKFINLGNDAIDISGTNIEISNILIDRAGDKGLSAGENSRIIAKNIDINNSEIAVASKDNSEITLENSSLFNNIVGFTAFQKKSEFGPAVITLKNVKEEKSKVKYLIEKKSRLINNNKTIYGNKKDVKNILYGKQYGKSSK